jgi:hypothetical protein
MKKNIKTIEKLGREELSKLLLTYVAKSNLVNKTVKRNRGGSREATFNESEVDSAANMTIHKVVAKVEEYRANLATSTKGVQKQFVDIPLFVKYFDRAFENLLKDLANHAAAQKRSRYAEILHTFNSDEVNVDDLHGSWDVVKSRDYQDILDEALYNLKEGMFEESIELEEIMVKVFNLHFKSRVQSDEELAREMKVKVEEATKLKTQLVSLLGKHCRNEMNDLMTMVRDNGSHWDTCREEAIAANKSSAATSRNSNEHNIKLSDSACEPTTVVIYKKAEKQIEVSVVVQIIRDASGVKEVAEVIKEFKTLVNSMDEAQGFQTEIKSEIKSAQDSAKLACAERRRLANSIFNSEAA